MTPPQTITFVSDGNQAILVRVSREQWWYRFTESRTKLGMEWAMTAKQVERLVSCGLVETDSEVNKIRK